MENIYLIMFQLQFWIAGRWIHNMQYSSTHCRVHGMCHITNIDNMHLLLTPDDLVLGLYSFVCLLFSRSPTNMISNSDTVGKCFSYVTY